MSCTVKHLIAVLIAADIMPGSRPLSHESKRVYLPRSLTGGIECPFDLDPPSTVILWSRGDQLFENEDSRVKLSRPIFSQKKRRLAIRSSNHEPSPLMVHNDNCTNGNCSSSNKNKNKNNNNNKNSVDRRHESFDLASIEDANQTPGVPEAPFPRNSTYDLATEMRMTTMRRTGRRLRVDRRVRVDRRGVLVIDDVDDADEGTYTCISYSNDGGRTSGEIQVFVRDLPKFLERPHSNYHKLVGETVTFPCRVESNPKANILWVKRKGPFPPTTRTLLDVGDLTIAHLSKDDQGLYSCFASNVAGVVVTTTKLIVRASKDCRPQKLRASSSGKSVEISWTPGYGVLHHVLWYRIKDAYERHWQTLSLSHPNVTTFCVFSLQAATNYSFMVMSRDGTGGEHFSEVVVATTGGIPLLDNYIEENIDGKFYMEKPSNLSALILANDSILITWSHRQTKELNDSEAISRRYDIGGYDGYRASGTINQVPVQKFLIDCRKSGDSVWHRLAEVPHNATSYQTTMDVLKTTIQNEKRATITKKPNLTIFRINPTPLRIEPSTKFKARAGSPQQSLRLHSQHLPSRSTSSVPCNTRDHPSTTEIPNQTRSISENSTLKAVDIQVSSWSPYSKAKSLVSSSGVFVLQIETSQHQKRQQQQQDDQNRRDNKDINARDEVDRLWTSGIIPTLFITTGILAIAIMISYWCYARGKRETKATQEEIQKNNIEIKEQ